SRAVPERSRHPQRASQSASRRGRTKDRPGAAQKLPCPCLFSTRTDLCQSGRGNSLRRAHFRDRPIDQARELSTLTAAHGGGMAKAIVDLAASCGGTAAIFLST